MIRTLAPALLSLLPLLAGTCPGQCLTYGSFGSQGKLPTGLSPAGTLEEVSGLEISRSNEDVLWMHDDKGAGPYLTAVSTAGQLRQQYLLANAGNLDWEDIAIGPGSSAGPDCIYLADIGDNNLNRLWVSLIRIVEPKVPATPGPTVTIQGAEVFNCQYPGGPRDAETLWIDPRDGTPYILTKENGNQGFVYRYPMPLDQQQTRQLVLVAAFTHPSPGFAGGDVAPDGRWIYARDKNSIYAWPRADNQTFAAAFQNPYCSFGAQNQGNAEGLAVAPNGTDLWSVSEGKGSDIWRALGVLPAGRVAVPSWWNYGHGLGSSQHGVPGLGMPAVPRLGGNASLLVHGAGPAEAGVVAFSATPVADGRLPFAGGWLNVQPPLLLLPAQTNAAGQASMALGSIPNNPALDGVQVFAQAAVNAPSAVRGLALSPGLVIQLGR